MTTIAAGIITYPIYPKRLEYLEQGLRSFIGHVLASWHDLTFFVSCEADPRGDVEAVRELCRKLGVLCCLHDGRPCMGANQNNAMRIAFEQLNADYLLSLIDDSHATEAVDLSLDVKFLDAHPEVDILRYHWSGRPGACPTFHERADGYMQVDPKSYRFYDDSPHIRRSTYVEKFGWNVEMTPADAGYVERYTCKTLRDRGANIIAMPTLKFGKGGLISACH